MYTIIYIEHTAYSCEHTPYKNLGIGTEEE